MLTKLDGKVEFRNLSFKYDSSDVNALSNISVDINAGETVALVGASGSGKSTLANLLPRFYQNSEGSILLDGEDIREIPLSKLHGIATIIINGLLESILFPLLTTIEFYNPLTGDDLSKDMVNFPHRVLYIFTHPSQPASYNQQEPGNRWRSKQGDHGHFPVYEKHPVQPGIAAVSIQQFCMTAAFYYAAIFQDNDAISIFNG